MYIYSYVRMYIQVHMCMCIYVCICKYSVYVCMYVCIYSVCTLYMYADSQTQRYTIPQHVIKSQDCTSLWQSTRWYDNFITLLSTIHIMVLTIHRFQKVRWRQGYTPHSQLCKKIKLNPQWTVLQHSLIHIHSSKYTQPRLCEIMHLQGYRLTVG